MFWYFVKWWVVLPLSPQSRLIIKHLQTLYTDLYTKTPDFNTFGRFLCAFFAGFYSFLYTTRVSMPFSWSLKIRWKNRQGLKERPFVFDTFWPGKVKTSITFDGIWPLLSIFWPLFDATHQISVKSWSQNERFLVKTWWFLTSERKLLQVSSNFQIENQAFTTIERKLPELSSKFLPGFAA